MIDLKQLRENPHRFIDGSHKKGMAVDIPRLLAMDTRKRELTTERERLRAEQAKVEKEIGPQIGKLAGALKKAAAGEQAGLQAQLDELKARPAALKSRGAALEAEIALIESPLRELLLTVPLPPDNDVPVGSGAEQNVEIRGWNPPGFDTAQGFETNRGFRPKSHLELVRDLKLADFERGVKMAGSRSYILTDDGFRLHQAILRYAFDFMVSRHGFRAMSVPVLVKESAMEGTGFFPAGRAQAYEVPGKHYSGLTITRADGSVDSADSYSDPELFLTGTGEVGLMGIHQGEILDEATLPRKYVTVSTCFRREAGAAGKDTAGLYRIHQFDKVEQVVICRADEAESRAWHKRMIGYVEELLQSLSLPYRLLQCCTGDLGPKNADMVDIECWMPGRGPTTFELLDEHTHYKLVGQPGDFWANIRPSRIDEYIGRNGDSFKVAIADDNCFYSIPYAALKSVLVADVQQPPDKQGGSRWIIHIVNDTLSATYGSLKREVFVAGYKKTNCRLGAYGETHSASRLYDYQCRRLNMRYRAGGEQGKGETVFCHSLNNTVAASPRILIPLLEIHQQKDGTVNIPEPLRPYMGGKSVIA